MTAYATRSPLQLIHNPHMMSQPRRSSRRLSARPDNQEDAQAVNGIAPGNEKSKSGQTPGRNLKQAKSGVNGTSSGAAGTKAKRKPVDYDEDSDGFKFTRKRAKKAKAEPAPQIQPIEEERRAESPPQPVPVKRTRKRVSSSPTAAPAEKGERPERRRRSPRNSSDLAAEEAPIPPLEVKKKRKPKDDGSYENRKSKRKDQATTTQQEDPAAVPEMPRIQPVDKPLDPIKVSLPFADTPIIRRNKEMRKGAENGSRRSSLGMRGRRASSLIDSGKSDALPHDEVDSSEFYKHIESSLTEPRRMKQLLTWCGTRALGEKPSSTQQDFHARQAAREIQQQLLKDFSTKSEMSDWFNRKDTTPPPQPPKPNPKNVSNEKKIKDLEQQLARLQSERQTWESLLRPPSESLSLTPLTANPDPKSISSELLASPSQIDALTTLRSPPSTDAKASSSSTSDSTKPTANDLQSSTSARIRHITSALEFTVDTFAMNVHALNAFADGADRVAGEILAVSAEALEERDRAGRMRGGGDADGEGEGEEREEVGMRDVLRGLSRVVDR